MKFEIVEVQFGGFIMIEVLKIDQVKLLGIIDFFFLAMNECS
jgi:hypothetical protein